MKIDGGCHCGFITYAAEADPADVGICHCTDCQKFSGGAFRVGVAVPEERFELLSGTPKTYVKTAESGAKRAQVFCPECGTPSKPLANRGRPYMTMPGQWTADALMQKAQDGPPKKVYPMSGVTTM